MPSTPRFLALLALLGTLLPLAGCGTKGALYLPQNPAQTQEKHQ